MAAMLARVWTMDMKEGRLRGSAAQHARISRMNSAGILLSRPITDGRVPLSTAAYVPGRNGAELGCMGGQFMRRSNQPLV